MKKYLEIVKHYESCFKKHGDNVNGMDWPNLEDAIKRYQVMLDVSIFNKDFEKNSILDFGCGTGHLLEYMLEAEFDSFDYSGIDISKEFINRALIKYPNKPFYCLDILDDENGFENTYDYVVMNGVFTEKRSLTQDEMFSFFKKMIKIIFTKHTNKGFAFNVMSDNVDWKREDLFHLSLDKLTKFLRNGISNNYIIRNDYGLYEYTVYVYK